MQTVSITALRPHGNVVSELTKTAYRLRFENYSQDFPLYPFLPLFYPLNTLTSLPSSKKEAVSILNPLKENMQESFIQPVLGDLSLQNRWITAQLSHPCLDTEPQFLQIAQFPPLRTGTGIPLSFFKDKQPMDLNIPHRASKNLRVFTLSILSFTWTETDTFSFSWGEIAHTWVKIETGRENSV